jgi:hypothetical protein
MFLAPAFMLGLLAVGLPLWLHRFARDTRERQPFASLMLLEQSDAQRSQQRELRYRKLLALRIAWLVALALAFAQFVLPARAPVVGESGATLHIIALDTSLSMRAEGRWSAARAAAERLIGEVRPGDRVMLVAADHRIRVVQGAVDADRAAALLPSVRTLTPTLSRLDYGLLMTSVPAWLVAERLPAKLHLITDLQLSARPQRLADLEVPAGVGLDLIDVAAAAPTVANQAITAIGPSERDPDVVVVRVSGSSAAARELTLLVDGEERARRTLPAGKADISVTFDDLDLGTRDRRLEGRLSAGDALLEDDRFFAVVKRVAPRLLIVAAGNAGDDAAYLAAAVGSLTRPRLAVERRTAESVRNVPFRDYAMVLVSDVGVLSPEVAGNLERYVREGGAVLMTLGPRAAGLAVMPLSGDKKTGDAMVAFGRGKEPARVASVDASHPVLREGERWRNIRFLRRVPIEARAGDQVLMSFEDGTPLLLERRVGTGRLLELTSPLDRDWSDFAVHPLFVRFMAETARYLTGVDTAPLQTTAGATLSAAALTRAGQIFDPSGARVLPLGGVKANTRIVPETQGFYELRGAGRDAWLAVNVDPREASLTRMSAADVKQWQRLRGTQTRGTAPASGPAAASLRPVWLWLLILAAALLFAETVVANFHLRVRREAVS